MRAGTISHRPHRQDQHRQRWNGENRRPPKTLKFGENEPETKKLKSSKTLKNFQSFLNFHFVKNGSNTALGSDGQGLASALIRCLLYQWGSCPAACMSAGATGPIAPFATQIRAVPISYSLPVKIMVRQGPARRQLRPAAEPLHGSCTQAAWSLVIHYDPHSVAPHARGMHTCGGHNAPSARRPPPGTRSRHGGLASPPPDSM